MNSYWIPILLKIDEGIEHIIIILTKFFENFRISFSIFPLFSKILVPNGELKKKIENFP